MPLIPLPFPPKAIASKEMKEIDRVILEKFKKVKVNIPLLDAIKQISCEVLEGVVHSQDEAKGKCEYQYGKELVSTDR